MPGPSAARSFLHANARLLERQVFAAVFENGRPDAVVAALIAYQNADGGFGHGLEPDKRSPASQPLDVEIAFEYLVSIGTAPGDVVGPACDWLASVSAASGAVPIVLPTIDGYPRAGHWNRTEYPPAINPTAAIAAHCHALGVSHHWVDRATGFCFAELEAGRTPSDAHGLLTLTKLVEVAPDRGRADAAAEVIASALPAAGYLRLDPESDGYGLTPLDFAPAPTSLARSWFADELIESHLDRLERDQEPDGGWPLTWEPPSEASRLEWRGMKTVAALRTLIAYGRWQP